MASKNPVAERLGIEPAELAGLSPCSEEDLARLSALLDDALHREDTAVEDGLRATLNAVPRPLRGRAKSLLFPGEQR